MEPDEWLSEGMEWIGENVDEEWLHALAGTDREQVERFFQAVEQRFQGGNVSDLASLKQAADMALPLLESHVETRPWAVWLKTRMDYFEVAEQLGQPAFPPAKDETNKPPVRLPVPEPKAQREVWRKTVGKRPLPPAAAPYVSRLKAVFAAHRAPRELVWLAEVESSFNPDARSPAGAVGMFQIMPKTAKSLGLSLWPRDERRHPEKSAAAAARYLKQLHGRFKDWRLALAAYNAGEGRVSGLLKRHNAKTFDQIAPKLPAETQLYVPKVEAVLMRREGVSLAALPPA